MICEVFYVCQIILFICQHRLRQSFAIPVETKKLPVSKSLLPMGTVFYRMAELSTAVSDIKLSLDNNIRYISIYYRIIKISVISRCYCFSPQFWVIKLGESMKPLQELPFSA